MYRRPNQLLQLFLYSFDAKTGALELMMWDYYVSFFSRQKVYTVILIVEQEFRQVRPLDITRSLFL